MKNRIKKEVLFLAAISILIYILQIIIFRDPKNTFFYIFQDFAFLPISIAIATIIVGEFMDQREKQERIEKTRMLTSSFFTEIGSRLTMAILSASEPRESLSNVLAIRCKNDLDLKERQDFIRKIPITVNLTKEVFEDTKEIILSSRTALLVLASNPLLMEHEDFSDLLWALFHLIDEFRLRGDFDGLTPPELHHLSEDYEKVMQLLLVNYIANAKYLQETYPNLYSAATKRIRKAVDEQ